MTFCKSRGVKGPHVKPFMVGRSWQAFLLKHFCDLVDSHVAEAVVISGVYIDKPIVHLSLAGEKDVVPLGELLTPLRFADVTVRAINFTLETKLVQVQVH